VQGQLKLWPTDESMPQGPPLWGTLTPNQQATVVTALAQVIALAVLNQPLKRDLRKQQESNHEQ
jgi:hypothetical protein